jgi:hypothetical protein
MGDNSGEQRSRPRIGIDVACRVTRGHAQWYGRCNDATLEGLRLDLQGPFALGDTLTIFLQGSDQEFAVAGTVVRLVGEEVGVALIPDVDSSRALFQLLLEQTRAQNDECERIVEEALARGGESAQPTRRAKPARLVSMGDAFDSGSDISTH